MAISSRQAQLPSAEGSFQEKGGGKEKQIRGIRENRPLPIRERKGGAFSEDTNQNKVRRDEKGGSRLQREHGLKARGGGGRSDRLVACVSRSICSGVRENFPPLGA